MEKHKIEIDNARQLHVAGKSLLEKAKEITASTGENVQSMSEIGKLLSQIARSEVMDELLALRPGGKRATVDVIAALSDGSMLSLYAMQNWQSPPHNDVHWHNYWQTLLVLDGDWPDTVWRPVIAAAGGIASPPVIDRREVFQKGTLQTLGPNEPHGWISGEIRSTEKAVLLMWSAGAKGKPRTVVDPETGRLTDEFGFLNPEPKGAKEMEIADDSTFSWNRF